MSYDFLILDGSSILVRAYFATVYPGRAPRSHEGTYTNAVLGFLNMFVRALEILRPSSVFVAWDVSRDTFRRELFPAYKGTRGELPDELLGQFDTMQDVLSTMGVLQYAHERYEADDIIGTLSVQAAAAGHQVLILTGDRDALQLVRDGVTVAIMKKGMTELQYNTPDSMEGEWGISAEQVPDCKGLMGDPSDNIPGIPGIGEKTAKKLLAEYGSLEQVLEHRTRLSGRLRNLIDTHADLAILSKRLATIDLTVPLPITPADCILRIQMQACADHLRTLNLERLVESLSRYVG